MITPCFAIENLSFTYPKSDTPALENLSLVVEEGAFLLLCGKTGSGKTTLLHMLKKEMTPHGIMQGKRLYKGDDIDGLDPRTSASQIGYIMQDPDSQLVCDSVARELAYGCPAVKNSWWRLGRCWQWERRFCFWTSHAPCWIPLQQQIFCPYWNG